MTRHPFFLLYSCLRAILIAGIFATTAYAQAPASVETTWADLAKVSFETRYDENAQIEILLPRFEESVRFLTDKEITITGYIIPVDVSNNYYVLSAFLFASCFFCGSAGPETVLDLNLEVDSHFKTDERLTFKGVLKLNHSDPYQLPYRLVNAIKL
jgi:hypothetical protein